MRLLKLIMRNFWPKVFSLALAVATWFYVFDLVNTDTHQKVDSIEELIARSTLIAKDLPVKTVFTGKSPEGYRVVFDKIEINPQQISVLGPEVMVEKLSELKTERIDLGEYTRSVILRLGIRSDVKALNLDDKVVEVILPIEKIKEEPAVKTEL